MAASRRPFQFSWNKGTKCLLSGFIFSSNNLLDVSRTAEELSQLSLDTENAMEKGKARYAVPVKKVTFKRQKLAEEEENGSHLLADNGTGARSMRSRSTDSLSWTPKSKDATLRVNRKAKPLGRNDSSSSSRHNATDLSVASMLNAHEGLISSSTPLAIGSLAGFFRANSSTPKTNNESFICSTIFGQNDELLAAVDLSNIVSQSCEGSEGKEPTKAEDKGINGPSGYGSEQTGFCCRERSSCKDLQLALQKRTNSMACPWRWKSCSHSTGELTSCMVSTMFSMQHSIWGLVGGGTPVSVVVRPLWKSCPIVQG